jgi:hypothetical protein
LRVCFAKLRDANNPQYNAKRNVELTRFHWLTARLPRTAWATQRQTDWSF